MCPAWTPVSVYACSYSSSFNLLIHFVSLSLSLYLSYLSIRRVPSSPRCWLLGTFPVSIPSFCLSFHHLNLSLSFHSAWRLNVSVAKSHFVTSYIYICIHIYTFQCITFFFKLKQLFWSYDFINGFYCISLGLQTFSFDITCLCCHGYLILPLITNCPMLCFM